jgi:hypothetical protein
MKYTDSELMGNYNSFISLLTNSFSGERQEKLLKLYDQDNFGYRAVFAPASSKHQYHSCYPGGYLDHINNVYKAALGIRIMWKMMGGSINFTDEELTFCALNHDLGKLGDIPGELYLPQDNEWALKKGEVYKLNPNLQFMTICDRTLFILQQYGLTMTWREWLSIKLCQGMYEDSNKPYMVNYNSDNELKTSLPRILQEADYIACRTECDKSKEKND